MKTTNYAWRNRVLCLQQPISILSILILLLNDHIFLILFPSWLTREFK